MQIIYKLKNIRVLLTLHVTMAHTYMLFPEKGFRVF